MDDVARFDGGVDSFSVSGDDGTRNVRAERSNSWMSDAGSFFPRRSARRKMPAHAFALKENLRGAFAARTVQSIITRGDNEDSSPPLCDPEPSGIESPPREAIPQRVHFTDESSEVAALIGREEARDVLQHEPPRSSSFHNVQESEGET
jgi:hypothetical protein